MLRGADAHLDGEAFAQSLQRFCTMAVELSTASIGPARGPLLLVGTTDVGKCSVAAATSCCERVLDHLGRQAEAVSGVALRLLQSHSKVHGDAGFLCLQLFGRLVLAAQDSGLPVAAIAEAYNRAATVATNHIASGDCKHRIPLKWNSIDQVLGFIVTMLGTKTSIGASTTEIRSLAVLLTRAFLSTVTEAQDQLRPLVLFTPCPGTALSNSSLLERSIVMSIPVGTQLPRKFSRASVALFECGLEFDLTSQFKENTRIICQSAQDTTSTCESDQIQRSFHDSFTRQMLQIGTNVVVSQRVIPAYLCGALAEVGIVALERLSIRYIGLMQHISGALPIRESSSIVNMNRSHLGFLESLEVQELFGKRFIVGTGPCDSTPAGTEADQDMLRQALQRVRPVSTVLLTCHSEDACDELKTVCEGITKVLTSSLTEQYVLPGGGSWLLHIAQVVRSQKPGNLNAARMGDKCDAWVGETRFQRYVSRAMEIFAQVLVNCAKSIVSSSNHKCYEMDETEFSSCVGFPEAECLVFRGLRPRTGSLFVVHNDSSSESSVLDPYRASLAAVSQAVEAAIVFIETDAYMVNKDL